MAMNEILAPRLLNLDVIRFIPFKEFTDRLPQAYLKLTVQLTQKLDLTGHTKGAAELPTMKSSSLKKPLQACFCFGRVGVFMPRKKCLNKI